jgi:hypothetical protein
MASAKAIGVSGIGVAMATSGAVLAYAAFSDQGLLEAIKSIASGKPKAIGTTGRFYARTSASSVDDSAAAEFGESSDASFNALVIGVSKFKSDRYSQAKRHQTGYSDCSSWVAKGMRSVGYDAPIPDNTLGFMRSKDWRTVSAKSAKRGDIIVNAAHMAVYLGDGKAVGQQNPSSNVRTGTVSSIMSGTGGSYQYMRYVGGKRPSADSTSAKKFS